MDDYAYHFRHFSCCKINHLEKYASNPRLRIGLLPFAKEGVCFKKAVTCINNNLKQNLSLWNDKTFWFCKWQHFWHELSLWENIWRRLFWSTLRNYGNWLCIPMKLDSSKFSMGFNVHVRYLKYEKKHWYITMMILDSTFWA